MPWDRATEQALPSHEVTHLHLLRHGRVDTGGVRRCYGFADYPLSAEGQREAEALVAFAAGDLPPPDGVISSDLRRCTAIAEPLAARLGVPLLRAQALREQHMGDWERESWADLTERDVARVRAYWTDYVDTRPPGGETYREMAARVDAFFEDRWADLRGRRWILVGHVGPVRALCCRLLGLPLAEALRFTPLPGSHTWFQVAEAGAVLQVLGERPLSSDPGAAGETRRGGPPREARPPRVALSGSAGTGKTTLGQKLSALWGVPYIPEGMRRHIEGGLRLHDLQHGQLRALVRDLWDEQRALEAEAIESHGGFIADRSSLDYAAFWLTYRFTDDRPATEAFFQETLAHAHGYDRVVLLPWGVLPLEADGVRSTNPWIQRHYQATVEGLLHRELPPHRLAVMPPLSDIEARAGWVHDLLHEVGVAGPSRLPGARGGA